LVFFFAYCNFCPLESLRLSCPKEKNKIKISRLPDPWRRPLHVPSKWRRLEKVSLSLPREENRRGDFVACLVSVVDYNKCFVERSVCCMLRAIWVQAIWEKDEQFGRQGR
jgi:hypothetical protein